WTLLCEIAYDVFRFFFQAEDGIRDFHVTGVQTCALPIYAVALDQDVGRIGAVPADVDDAAVPDNGVGSHDAPPLDNDGLLPHGQIGRASCRGRVILRAARGSLTQVRTSSSRALTRVARAQ